MTQLRHDYQEFQALNAQVVVVVPNGPKTIARYVSAHPTPYPILSDKGSKVAAQYKINIKRVPLVKMAYYKTSVFLVDQTGLIRYTNYQTSYTKEPDNREPLAVLEGMTLRS